MEKELLMEEQEENMRKYKMKKNMLELYSQQKKGARRPIIKIKPPNVSRKLNNDITPSELSEKSYFDDVVENRESDAPRIKHQQ